MPAGRASPAEAPDGQGATTGCATGGLNEASQTSHLEVSTGSPHGASSAGDPGWPCNWKATSPRAHGLSKMTFFEMNQASADRERAEIDAAVSDCRWIPCFVSARAMAWPDLGLLASTWQWSAAGSGVRRKETLKAASYRRIQSTIGR